MNTLKRIGINLIFILLFYIPISLAIASIIFFFSKISGYNPSFWKITQWSYLIPASIAILIRLKSIIFYLKLSYKLDVSYRLIEAGIEELKFDKIKPTDQWTKEWLLKEIQSIATQVYLARILESIRRN